MSNWRQVATETSGREQKPDLTAGKYKDLKVVKNWGPTQKDANRVSLSVVSEGHEGFANLYLQLNDEWKHDAIIALAMGEEAIKAAQATGDITAREIAQAREYIHNLASEKVANANTPDTEVEAATDKQTSNILTQIKINIGTLWRLQEWGGFPANEHANLDDLVGVKFAGRIEEFGGKLTVKDVYATPKGYVAPERDTSFARSA